MSMIGFYTGVSGMIAHQQELDNVAHNIANVNTFGFKTRKAEFSDLLYSKMYINNERESLTGHGVKQFTNDLMYKQGGLYRTELPLDFAIMGDGLFAVQKKDAIEYTRNGAFSLSMEGDKAMLTTGDGAYVLDASQQPIEIATDPETKTPILDGLAEKLGVYAFSNPYGLTPTNGSRFLKSENSGEPIAVTRAAAGTAETTTGKPACEVLSGSLENSIVDLGSEMVNVIRAQRAFQLNSKVVQTADQMEETINTLR